MSTPTRTTSRPRSTSGSRRTPRLSARSSRSNPPRGTRSRARHEGVPRPAPRHPLCRATSHALTAPKGRCRRIRHRLLTAAALGSVALLALAGCGAGAADGDDETMTIGFLPSWTDAVNNAYLLQDQFEKMGFTVEMEELTEPGLLYTALAEGDVDNEFDDGDEPAAIDAWLAEYGDQFEWVVD
ncbi:hypothetical protein GJQ66_05740 [Microbacterium sp. ZXX196]|nr:hypothetical protein [Microbacterium sp. ZXX196]